MKRSYSPGVKIVVDLYSYFSGMLFLSTCNFFWNSLSKLFDLFFQTGLVNGTYLSAPEFLLHTKRTPVECVAREEMVVSDLKADAPAAKSIKRKKAPRHRVRFILPGPAGAVQVQMRAMSSSTALKNKQRKKTSRSNHNHCSYHL